jgi:hypothetical protein
LQNSYDIHLKSSFVEKDSIARIEKQYEQIQKYQILFDKQLVNLVNDNIKKWYLDFNNQILSDL